MKPHHYLLNKDWEPTIVYPELMKEGREADYRTLSGWSLTGEEEPKEDVEEEKLIESINIALEKIYEDYKSIFGKNVPVNKKNDIERIQEKINETLTPVE